jgi:hypothetical protein
VARSPPGGDSEDNLHNERDREPEHAVAQGDQKSGHFPSDEAPTKMIYLALRNITKKRKKPPVT